LFLPGNPERERLSVGRCFARYVVVEDPAQRRSSYAALQRWMAESADLRVGPAGLEDSLASPDALVRGGERSSLGSMSGRDSRQAGFVSGHDFSRAINAALPSTALAAAATLADASEPPKSSNKEAQIGPPAPIPSGF
jgi:hypothetical protein